MKTYKQWEESNLDWDDFFQPGDIIDEEAYNDILETVSPQFHHCDETSCFGQNGECYKEEKGVRYYTTVAYYRSTDTYQYLGILPRFKQPKS